MAKYNRFKEAFKVLTGKKETSARAAFKAGRRGAGDLKTSKFITDLYNEAILTPHEEMRQSQVAYRTNAKIVTAVELLTDAIIGKELKTNSKNERTREVFNNIILPELKAPLREAIENMVITGNGYVEILRGEPGEGPSGFKPIPSSERVYIQFSNGFEPEQYILQVNTLLSSNDEVQNFTIDVDGAGTIKTIRGIPFKKQEIMHIKMGISHIPVYGRSGLASAVNDVKIIKELERDMAVIARWKALAKYWIEINSNEEGGTVSPEEMQEIENYVGNLNDFDNPLFSNKKITMHDMGYSGQHTDLMPMLEYLTDKVTGALGPSFYIHANTTNYAVAKEQKNTFFLKVQSMRESIASAINPVLKEIATKRGLSSDVSISFGDFDFPTREERVREAQQAFNTGGMTLNEYRRALELEELPESDEGGIGDAFIFELQDNKQALERAVQSLTARPAQNERSTKKTS